MNIYAYTYLSECLFECRKCYEGVTKDEPRMYLCSLAVTEYRNGIDYEKFYRNATTDCPVVMTIARPTLIN